MTIFEIDKDALLGLSDEQLEELVARLSEAEVSARGGNVADVRWAGSINAPDGGVDVGVVDTSPDFAAGFIPRANTVFQAKVHSMPSGAITSEMRPAGALAPIIAAQVKTGGAYVIVSLADDCSPPTYAKRVEAMQAAVAGDPNAPHLHVDFYDRSKLHQWLRQHPAVQLWVRTALGIPLSGWQPYGRWSNTPAGLDDSLISAPGISVTLPAGPAPTLSLEDAIVPVRNLIRNTSKCIRITGLSGVGKTRFAQALFDETIGTDALDRTQAIYVDTGADPTPSAHAMLEALRDEGRNAIIVLDNCPTALHSHLAGRVVAAGSRVKLITVEYDIRDDKPQTTEVVHIEADGPEVAELLVTRRYPTLGEPNARRIAEFANGNARVALALAERVEVGEPLAKLSDAHLFDRLFQQRNEPDGQLRMHAEVLSLVYSYSVEPSDGIDELAALGALGDASPAQLFRSTARLLDRHIAQKRGKWRAILPHAIANRLADSALNSIPTELLHRTFEQAGQSRLLRSFAHRLGLMHDHPVAQKIVRTWLSDGGPLVKILELDEKGAEILAFVAPVAPDLVLDRIEAEINASGFAGIEVRHNPRRSTVLNLLSLLAYEPPAFERCVSLLMAVADFEDPSNNNDPVRGKIARLFQPYLSGTHATIEQREQVLRDHLWSADQIRREMGLRMLAATLDGPPWTGDYTHDFGARPRDYGSRPDGKQLVKWWQRFIDVAVEAGLSPDPDLADRARSVFAGEFRGLWWHATLQDKLTEAARALHAQRPWPEGWKAVRKTIYFDYRKEKKNNGKPKSPPKQLLDLRSELAPTDLMSRIDAFVLAKRHDLWALDDDIDHDDSNKYRESEERMDQVARELGVDFARAGMQISQLRAGLFSRDWGPYRSAFGQGLAAGSANVLATWADLIENLRSFGLQEFNFAVLCGFIAEVKVMDPSHACQILDGCAVDRLLRSILVHLHPVQGFDEGDFDRCMSVFGSEDVGAWMYGDLLWRDQYASIPAAKLADLGRRLLEKESGDNVLLEALNMSLHDKDSMLDVLGPELRRLGLVAATRRLRRDQSDPGGSTDYAITQVLTAALKFEGNDAEKLAWLDAIFDVVDQRHGFLGAFDEAVQVTAAIMTGPFLERVFSGDDATRELRLHFLQHGMLDRLPLSAMNIQRLIDWCSEHPDQQIWALVARGLMPFSSDGESTTVALTNAGLAFLEVSPAPDEVLNAFASRIKPMSWSGSCAAIMQRRAAAFEPLLQHENKQIAEAAKSILAEAEGWISREAERERQRDAEREQTFE